MLAAIWPVDFLLPGMKPDALRRNALVIIGYLLVLAFLIGFVVRVI